ncbi:MAG: TOBE domain-containing protein [Bacilli bacterium]|nr:TOBE domain-containing protein [Bacilli bacterium]
MNFIKVHLAVSDNKTEITFANHTMTLDPSVNSSHLLDKYNGKDIMMGIRPEAITLATPENKASVAEDAIVDVHIKMAEFLGAEIYFYFDLDGVQHIARIPSSYQVHSDMDAKIVIDSRRCYFFDPETQETLVYSLQSKSVPVKF